MTPLFAYLLCVGFVAFLMVGAWLLEETEAGRRLADRAIDRIVR